MLTHKMGETSIPCTKMPPTETLIMKLSFDALGTVEVALYLRSVYMTQTLVINYTVLYEDVHVEYSDDDFISEWLAWRSKECHCTIYERVLNRKQISVC